MGRTIDQVIAGLSPERQAKIDARSLEFTAAMIVEAKSLSMVRKAHDKTQEELANKLGVKTNAITQLEKRTDMLLSTLRKYIRACGADLVLSVQMRDGHTVKLESLMQFTSVTGSPLRASPKPGAKAVPASRKQPARAMAEKSASTKATKRLPAHA